MLRWCLPTLRVLGGVDATQGTRAVFSASARVKDSFARLQTTNTHGNSISLTEPPQLEIADSTINTSHTKSDCQCYIENSGGASDVRTTFITGIQKLRPSGESFPEDSAMLDSQEHNTFNSLNWDPRTRAITALQDFLTTTGIFPDPLKRPTPNTIRSLYISAKARGQLSQLDSGMLSSLIGLFGSLSVDPSSRCVYTSSLLPIIRSGPVQRDYWAFVKELASFKVRRGMTLAHSDSYWMMRAELASLLPREKDQRYDTPASNRALFNARRLYLHFSRHAFDPEVHLPYLMTLLSSVDPTHRRWAVDALSLIIRKHSFLHAKVLKVLWDVVRDIDAVVLELILAAIVFRLTHSLPRRRDATEPPIPAVFMDVTTLTHYLSAFPLPTASGSHGKAITELLHGAFSSGVPEVERRSNLLTCCLLYNCDGNGTPMQSLNLFSGPDVSLWKILFGLAILEKIAQAAGPTLLLDLALCERLREMALSFQNSWLGLLRIESHSTLISRAVMISLFRLAGAVADRNLFATCLESSKNLKLWDDNSPDAVEGPQLAVMAATHLAALVQIVGCKAELVVETLNSFSTDAQLRNAVLSTAVKELIHRDVELAHVLYSLAISRGSDIDIDATYALVKTLPPSRSVCFLSDERFSREQLGGILSSIARYLKETKPRRYDIDVFIDIGTSLRKLYATSLPPSHFRGHLQSLILELCVHGSGFQATAIIASIIKFQPTFFQPSFLIHLTGLLLRRKQFRCALRLQRICVDTRVGCAFKLRRMVSACLWTAGSGRLSGSAFLPGHRANGLFGRDPFWRERASFKNPANNGPLLNRVLRSLIFNGRANAAKVTFNRIANEVDTKSRTTLGNTLLHGVLVRPLPRNGRRVRKFLGLLDTLVKCHGFVPDRITINIVLKALISWRAAFDHQRLRALFNHMVRSGYPAGTYSHSCLPFNTPPLRASGSLALSKLPSYISFEKHMKPMFKMFIKAFYLRNDVEAAHMVVGILKIEQQKASLQRAMRSAARLRGQMEVQSARQRDYRGDSC